MENDMYCSKANHLSRNSFVSTLPSTSKRVSSLEHILAPKSFSLARIFPRVS